jgi:hypothetical protein
MFVGDADNSLQTFGLTMTLKKLNGIDMALLKLVGLVWFFLFLTLVLGFIVGIIIEKSFEETHPIKKWWRKHLVAPDPEDNNWKNIEP